MGGGGGGWVSVCVALCVCVRIAHCVCVCVLCVLCVWCVVYFMNSEPLVLLGSPTSFQKPLKPPSWNNH